MPESQDDNGVRDTTDEMNKKVETSVFEVGCLTLDAAQLENLVNMLLKALCRIEDDDLFRLAVTRRNPVSARLDTLKDVAKLHIDKEEFETWRKWVNDAKAAFTKRNAVIHQVFWPVPSSMAPATLALRDKGETKEIAVAELRELRSEFRGIIVRGGDLGTTLEKWDWSFYHIYLTADDDHTMMSEDDGEGE